MDICAQIIIISLYRLLKLNCQRCGYGWNYSGKSKYYATCPKCLIHVSIPQNKTEELKLERD